MKMCEAHWAKIRASIDTFGLTQFVSKTGAEALDSTFNYEVGDESKPFDPLMAVTFMIYSHALESGGPYLLFGKAEGGEYCPICEAVLHSGPQVSAEESENYWVTGPVEAVYNEFRHSGFLQTALN